MASSVICCTTISLVPKTLKLLSPKKTSIISPLKFPKNGVSKQPTFVEFQSISATRTNATSANSTSTITTNQQRHCVVVVKPPPLRNNVSKSDFVDYFVNILQLVLGSEKDAQMCIYNVSFDRHFGFCCDIDEETSRELECLPVVLSVRPDPNFNSEIKDYSYPNNQLSPSSIYDASAPLFPAGTTKHWHVRLNTPPIGIITKAQVVDYYVSLLTRVLGNEGDAQMCIYNISWQSNYGFCCELDDECANELAGVPGIHSVQLDENAGAENKGYKGDDLDISSNASDSATDELTNIKTKKLFVTGLSFYTSEKTLRAAFEGFGELVEVRIIMDKISKRSKGYAFIEYTTEEAASAALKEMNGKIINGWMIVVDVAKTKPPKYSRGRPIPGS